MIGHLTYIVKINKLIIEKMEKDVQEAWKSCSKSAWILNKLVVEREGSVMFSVLLNGLES